LNIDFSNPWWDANCADGYELDGKLFIMANDTSVSNLAGARFFFFNKNLLKTYQLPSPYTYNQDENWTLDNFLSLVNSVYSDDGDQVRTGNDTYGLLMETGASNGNAIHMLVGCGIKFSSKDQNGMVEVNLDVEKIDNIFGKLSSVLKGDCCLTYSDAASGAEYSEFGNKYNYGRNLFAQNHFLFVQANMGVSNQVSDMEGDGYGIAPNPKYTADQESYYHKMDKLSNIWGIPNSTQLDFEMIANVMDYWAYESSKTVMPAYYEITIKTRRINDPYDSEMLDVIKSTIFYDVSEVFGIDVTTALWTGYTTNSFASTWRSSQISVAKQVKSFNEKITALD
jgi:ABC-type glycerol-3-phosphate transport system substrate-binding protein